MLQASPSHSVGVGIEAGLVNGGLVNGGLVLGNASGLLVAGSLCVDVGVYVDVGVCVDIGVSVCVADGRCVPAVLVGRTKRLMSLKSESSRLQESVLSPRYSIRMPATSVYLGVVGAMRVGLLLGEGSAIAMGVGLLLR